MPHQKANPLEVLDFEPVCIADIAQGLQVEAPDEIDFSETGENGRRRSPAEDVALDTSSLVKRRRTNFRTFLDLSKVASAVRQIRKLPGNEETLHAIMGGDFNAWELVPAIHEILGRRVNDLVITTLGFNHKNIDQLCAMLDAGAIGRATILCQHYFKNADPDVFNEAADRMAQRRQLLSATRNHSKIILIDAKPAHYVVESSANLRTCNNLEQFTLTRSKPLFDFHRGWIWKVLKELGAV